MGLNKERTHADLSYPSLSQNGGLMITSKTGSSLPGLYCSGEVTGGVHGRNRLMGNSLLGILVFGRRAGLNASEYAKGISDHRAGAGLTLEHIANFEEELRQAEIINPNLGPIILPIYAPDHVKQRQMTLTF